MENCIKEKLVIKCSITWYDRTAKTDKEITETFSCISDESQVPTAMEL